MFSQSKPRNLFEAATRTLGLIHDQAVVNIRKTHGSPIIGLLLMMVQAMVMAAGFLLMFLVMGVKTSPIRGPYVIYLLSGVLIFMTHSMTMGAVAGAPKASSTQMLHAPMNTAVAIGGAALAVLYKQTLSFTVILYGYHVLFAPFHIEDIVSTIGMFVLAWLSGMAIGLCFYAATPWWPTGIGILTKFYQRANMVFSGKFFVANLLGPGMLKMFVWNPLFHIVDQTRGYVFINYTPYFTSWQYAMKVTLALGLIGLMGEFVTRQAISASWTAGK